MHCTLYRADLAPLIAALTDHVFLERYRQQLADELPSLADRSLALHLRRLTTLAAQALGDGFDRLAEQDRAGADALLTDAFAVATFHAWHLPVQVLGDHEVSIAGQPRGLLGADAGGEGAGLWVLEDRTIALSRNRVVDVAVSDAVRP